MEFRALLAPKPVCSPFYAAYHFCMALEVPFFQKHIDAALADLNSCTLRVKDI